MSGYMRKKLPDPVKTQLPFGSYGASAIDYNGRLYIIGGWNSENLGLFDYCYYLDDENEEWIQIPNCLEYGVEFGASVIYDEQIHVLGGMKLPSGHCAHEIITENSSIISDDIPYDFQYGAAVVYKGKIHILGGYNFPNNHYSWDPLHGWQNVGSDIPYNFRYGAAVVYNNKIHILGDSYKHYSWSRESGWINEGDLPRNLASGAAVVYDNKIYIIGYQQFYDPNAGGMVFDRYIYSWVNGTQWDRKGDLSFRFISGSCAVHNSFIHVMGTNSGNDDYKKQHDTYPLTGGYKDENAKIKRGWHAVPVGYELDPNNGKLIQKFENKRIKKAWIGTENGNKLVLNTSETVWALIADTSLYDKEFTSVVVANNKIHLFAKNLYHLIYDPLSDEFVVDTDSYIGNFNNFETVATVNENNEIYAIRSKALGNSAVFPSYVRKWSEINGWSTAMEWENGAWAPDSLGFPEGPARIVNGSYTCILYMNSELRIIAYAQYDYPKQSNYEGVLLGLYDYQSRTKSWWPPVNDDIYKVILMDENAHGFNGRNNQPPYAYDFDYILVNDKLYILNVAGEFMLYDPDNSSGKEHRKCGKKDVTKWTKSLLSNNITPEGYTFSHDRHSHSKIIKHGNELYSMGLYNNNTPSLKEFQTFTIGDDGNITVNNQQIGNPEYQKESSFLVSCKGKMYNIANEFIDNKWNLKIYLFDEENIYNFK